MFALVALVPAFDFIPLALCAGDEGVTTNITRAQRDAAVFPYRPRLGL